MHRKINTYSKSNLVLYTNLNYKKTKSSVAENSQVDHSSVMEKINAYQDIDYEEFISFFKNNVLHKDKIYVCEMLNKSAYKHLEYLEISTSTTGRLFLYAEVNFNPSKWDNPVNLLSFTDTLRDLVQERHAITSEQHNLFEEDLIHLKFQVLVSKRVNIHHTIQHFSEKLLSIHNGILSKSLQTKAC